MTARLVITEDAYRLQLADGARLEELAALRGGAGALLPGRHPFNEATLERAIELAEDWLMPHAPRLRGRVLEVIDATGRLRSGMEHAFSERASSWRVADLEQLFLRLVDMATARSPSPVLQGRHALVADLVLLRELAHHGAVREITLM